MHWRPAHGRAKTAREPRNKKTEVLSLRAPARQAHRPKRPSDSRARPARERPALGLARAAALRAPPSTWASGRRCATKSTDFVETQPDTGCDTLKRAVPFAAVPSPVIVKAVPGGQVATNGESNSTPSLTIAPPATRAGTMKICAASGPAGLGGSRVSANRDTKRACSSVNDVFRNASKADAKSLDGALSGSVRVDPLSLRHLGPRMQTDGPGLAEALARVVVRG